MPRSRSIDGPQRLGGAGPGNLMRSAARLAVTGARAAGSSNQVLAQPDSCIRDVLLGGVFGH